jgi:hypothetical protein
MMETSVLTRDTRRHIAEDDILLGSGSYNERSDTQVSAVWIKWK